MEILKHPYWKLEKFIAPLAFTVVAQDLAEQALNRSLASSTNAVVELASFGIAFKILQHFTGAVEDLKYVSVVLLRCQKDRKKIILFSILFTLMSFIAMIIVGFTPVGKVIITDLHGVSEEVTKTATKMIYMFSVYPFLDALAWIHTGILIKHKYSFVCGISSISDVTVQVVTVVAILQTNFNDVIYIPLIAIYAGVITRLTVLLVAYYKYVNHVIPEEVHDAEMSRLTFKNILNIWTPLMTFRLCQRVSRPLINLFVARDRRDGFTQQNGTQALAVLSVIWPLCQIPYRWLDEVKVLESTFAKTSEETNDSISVKRIRSFGFLQFLISALIAVTMFWIPGVAKFILKNIISVDDEFVARCIVPLKILAIIPLPVIFRTLSTGWLLHVKRTSALYPSVIGKLGLTLIMLVLLPRASLHGAVMGSTALVTAAMLEAGLVVLATGYVKIKRRRKEEHIKSTEFAEDELNVKAENTPIIQYTSAL